MIKQEWIDLINHMPDNNVINNKLDELDARIKKLKYENLQLRIRNVDLNDTINTFNRDVDRVKEELDRLTVYYTTKLGNELLCKKAVKRVINKYLGDYIEEDIDNGRNN